MSQFGYDLAVAYRIYPKASASHPPIFAEDKFKLAELCFKSFKASLGNLRVKLWVLLNNCPPEYEALFKTLWPADDLVLVRFPGVAASTTLHEQSRILMEQTDAEIVFLSEDDYFHLPGQFQLAVHFLKQNPDADFVAPYDHLDNHTTDLHKLSAETREFGGRKWRSSVSTTHTFLAKRAALIESQKLFQKLHQKFYGRVSPDLAMWMALTKKRVCNPWSWIRSLGDGLYFTASHALAWRYAWRQILFGKRQMLWSPEPALITHMETSGLAPGTDWTKTFAERATALQRNISRAS